MRIEGGHAWFEPGDKVTSHDWWEMQWAIAVHGPDWLQNAGPEPIGEVVSVYPSVAEEQRPELVQVRWEQGLPYQAQAWQVDALAYTQGHGRQLLLHRSAWDKVHYTATIEPYTLALAQYPFGGGEAYPSLWQVVVMRPTPPITLGDTHPPEKWPFEFPPMRYVCLLYACVEPRGIGAGIPGFAAQAGAMLITRERDISVSSSGTVRPGEVSALHTAAYTAFGRGAITRDERNGILQRF